MVASCGSSRICVQQNITSKQPKHVHTDIDFEVDPRRKRDALQIYRHTHRLASRHIQKDRQTDGHIYRKADKHTYI